MTLRERRQAKGWTLMEVAKRAESTAANIFNYENGVYKPKYAFAKKLAEVFGCTVAEIYAGFEEKDP